MKQQILALSHILLIYWPEEFYTLSLSYYSVCFLKLYGSWYFKTAFVEENLVAHDTNVCEPPYAGYLCKDKSDNGVRKILEDGLIPLDRLLVETDSPFMYPNTRASKLPAHVKEALTERFVVHVLRKSVSVCMYTPMIICWF
jgi:hypothetical protein